MKDVTILIQGKISQESYNYYVETFPQFPIVISTWSDHTLDLSYFPNNLQFIQSKLPKESGMQNMNYQFISTINGLNNVTTKYVIKVRGDEYYSNIDFIRDLVETKPDKIWTVPVFFRHGTDFPYHISDHLMAATTENLKFMFGATKYAFDNKLIYHINEGERHYYWEPEINLTKGYLMAKYPEEYHTKKMYQIMVENFDIIPLTELKPYKVIANIFKTYWYSNFTPELNQSISKIEQLLDETPPY
jgi:hypothetical protein